MEADWLTHRFGAGLRLIEEPSLAIAGEAETCVEPFLFLF